MKFNFEFAEKISRTYSDECRPLCHELKLPQTAFDILMFLANNPEYKTARDIVEIRKIKANLVSVNVDKLVNEGYLERKPVENDRRKTELVCTKKAGTVIERGRRIQQQFTADLFAGIDEEQKRQLTIVMEQLENNMDEIIRRKSSGGNRTNEHINNYNSNIFCRYGRRPWNRLCWTKRSSSNKPYAHYIFGNGPLYGSGNSPVV